MSVVSMKELLESGVHFGHRTHKWNPKMKPFIFTERNHIHIIDLQKTLKGLEEAYAVVRDQVAVGGTVLFVGTKRQAQETIQLEATRCGMPWVTARWLGGTMTNWITIRQRINELERLERMKERGDFAKLTKKEALGLDRKIDRLDMLIGGIRDMVGVPELVFIVDVRREDTAVHEANLLNVPVVAMVDTNCDPNVIDYIIPANDDAIRAIKLIVGKIADAVLEGQAMRKDIEEEEPKESAAAFDIDSELTDEDLLGDATLAKLEAQRIEEEAELEAAGFFSDEEEIEVGEIVLAEGEAEAAGEVEDAAETAEDEVLAEDAPVKEIEAEGTEEVEPEAADEADEVESSDEEPEVEEPEATEEVEEEAEVEEPEEVEETEEETEVDEPETVDETEEETEVGEPEEAAEAEEETEVEEPGEAAEAEEETEGEEEAEEEKTEEEEG